MIHLHRPISHQSSIYKLLERIVSKQLLHFLLSNNILDKYQSTYLPHRSTETALKYIINDIIISMGHGLYTYLNLFELYTELDTLNHYILSKRLNELGTRGQVHAWFMAYISHRTFLKSKLIHYYHFLLLTPMVFHKVPFWDHYYSSSILPHLYLSILAIQSIY